MIAIIDYGAGNLRSIKKAVENIVGKNVKISSDKKEISKADGIVLPGVGAFSPAMKFLKEKNLIETITDFAKTGKLVLGICLGMQLFFEESEESLKTRGLGLLKGKVKKLPVRVKLPHIGWNCIELKIKNEKLKIAKDIKDHTFYYFVHSYYCEPEDKNIIVATTEYGIKFASIIEKDNIIGTQFHPEKSSESGIKLLKGILEKNAYKKDNTLS